VTIEISDFSSNPDTSARWPPTNAGGHRFLANGPGGLPRAVLWAAISVCSNLLQLVAIMVMVGWPLGRLLASDFMFPELVERSKLDEADLVFELPLESRHWAPVVLLLFAAAVVTLASALVDRSWWRTTSRVVAVPLVGVGGLAGFVLVVGPWVLVQMYTLGDGVPLFRLGGVSLIAVLGAIAGVVRNPLRKAAPRLGGVALVIGLLAVLGKVVHDSAIDGDSFGSVWWLVAATCVVLAYALLLDTQLWSIRELYRARLTNAFVVDPSQRPVGVVKRRSGSGGDVIGLTWQDLATGGATPDLVVCCSASRVGLAPNGLPAESFTISSSEVVHHLEGGARKVETSEYTKRLRSLALQPLQGPAGWMATSGAAMASAMGRKSMGTTNALMAAVNADLGVWLPSVVHVGEGKDWFPPVRLGHLSNEILGTYASDRDHFVFVADGGHVENLGLVELLRRKHRTIVCIDASNDQSGSFSTLRNALSMADTELEDADRLWFDLSEIDNSATPPRSMTYRIPFHRWNQRWRPHGTIHYAKLQNAQDQPHNVRQFANTDPEFPNYSTANQLLTDQQFVFLLVAGHHAGSQVTERLRDLLLREQP
jgi:hypothetical protein